MTPQNNRPDDHAIIFLYGLARRVDESLAAWRASGQPTHPELMGRFLKAKCLLITNVSTVLGGVLINFHELSDDELLAKAFIFARTLDIKHYVPATWPEASVSDLMNSIQNDTAVIPGDEVANAANALGKRLCDLVMQANGFEVDTD